MVTTSFGTNNIIVVIIIICVVLVGWYFLTRNKADFKKMRKLADEIEENGIRVDAVVKKIDRIGASGGTTYFYMVLGITLPDGTQYEVSRNEFLDHGGFVVDPITASHVAKVGAKITVIVHPTEHQYIYLDGKKLMNIVTNQ